MLATFFPIFAGFLLAVSGGIIMTRLKRHALCAKWCLRLSMVFFAVYPVSWARSLPVDYPVWKWIAGELICALVLGLGYYGAGFWYRFESPHNLADDGKLLDDGHDTPQR